MKKASGCAGWLGCKKTRSVAKLAGETRRGAGQGGLVDGGRCFPGGIAWSHSLAPSSQAAGQCPALCVSLGWRSSLT